MKSKAKKVLGEDKWIMVPESVLLNNNNTANVPKSKVVFNTIINTTYFILVAVLFMLVIILSTKVISWENDNNCLQIIQEFKSKNDCTLVFGCSEWSSLWYNCAHPLENFTGKYCDGVMICQKEWRCSE